MGKLAQPYFDRERAKKNAERWKTLKIAGILILGVITIGILEKNDFLTRQNTQLKKEVQRAKADGRQEILEQIEKEGELVQMKNGQWYWAVKGEFTDY